MRIFISGSYFSIKSGHDFAMRSISCSNADGGFFVDVLYVKRCLRSSRRRLFACAEDGEACFMGFSTPPAIFSCGEQVGPYELAYFKGEAVEVA